MGTFSVGLEVGNLNGGEYAAVEALVDTGASYTVLGSDLLERLGVRQTEQRRFQLGDDSFVEYGMGYAGIRLEGQWGVTPVIFGPAEVSPLLGAVTLQEFGLIADSVNERLIPAPPVRTRPVQDGCGGGQFLRATMRVNPKFIPSSRRSISASSS